MTVRRLCAEFGCPELTEGARCPKHEKAQEDRRIARNMTSREVYGSRYWPGTRKAILLRDRFCKCPLDDCHGAASCMRVATQADHIVPIERGGLPFAQSNLRGVCASCHGRITKRGNPDVPPAV